MWAVLAFQHVSLGSSKQQRQNRTVMRVAPERGHKVKAPPNGEAHVSAAASGDRDAWRTPRDSLSKRYEQRERPCQGTRPLPRRRQLPCVQGSLGGPPRGPERRPAP